MDRIMLQQLRRSTSLTDTPYKICAEEKGRTVACVKREEGGMRLSYEASSPVSGTVLTLRADDCRESRLFATTPTFVHFQNGSLSATAIKELRDCSSLGKGERKACKVDRDYDRLEDTEKATAFRYVLERQHV